MCQLSDDRYFSTTNSAPFLFNKLFRPLIKHWGSQGIQVHLYLDDGLIIAATKAECAQAAQVVRRDLRSAGVCEAREKCCWEPTQVITWLGVIIDLHLYSLAITEKRLLSTE